MRAVDRIRGPSRSSDVPVVRRSAGAGPCVVVTAGVHGDELIGFAACLELERAVDLACGELVLYPVLNPVGIAARTRALDADGADLNRAFPGDPAGSQAERHAARIWRDLVGRRPAALIDLHADAPTAIPYALVDRVVTPGHAADLEQRAVALARASGLPVLREYPPDQYRRFGLDRSLAGAALNHLGIPTVTLEIGPRRVIDVAAVGHMVAAVVGQLVHLGMVAGERRDAGQPLRIRDHTPRARAAGVFVPALAAGAPFRRGDLLGRIVGLDGTERDAVHAHAAGIVVGWAEGGWVEAGGIAGTLGLEDADG